MEFMQATTLAEALTALATGARPVAGGSDLVVGARQGKAPLPSGLVAIDRLPELCHISAGDDGGLRIGAGVSHATIELDPTIVTRYTALADGSALVGSPATRHVGTIGGNVMNGSPAMDSGAPLSVLAATVRLESSSRPARTLPVGELWTGPGRTSAAADELCTAILLPARPPRSGSAYVRLEYRRAMEIAIVGAAASVTLGESGEIAAIALALTAVAPTILEVDAGVLAGRPIDAQLLDDVAQLASSTATPISDLRAGDRYRRHTVGVMARRAVDAAARRARGESIGVPVNRVLGIGAAR